MALLFNHVIVGYSLKCLGTSKIIVEGVGVFWSSNYFLFCVFVSTMSKAIVCLSTSLIFAHTMICSDLRRRLNPLIPPAYIRHSDSTLGIFMWKCRQDLWCLTAKLNQRVCLTRSVYTSIWISSWHMESCRFLQFLGDSL